MATNYCQLPVAVVIVLIIACWLALPSATSPQKQQNGMFAGDFWLAQNLSYVKSSAGSFCFGWLRLPSDSHNFYVAVWYAGLDGAVVWVANRDAPAAANDTLQLTHSGNLLLTAAASSNPIWQTTTASPQTSSLQILDSGNAVLVLEDGSYSWQSFSFPSDTLLPSQSFLADSILSSRAPTSPISLASGHFKFYINPGGAASIDYFSASTGTSMSNIWTAPTFILVPVDAVEALGIAARFLTNGIFCSYDLSDGSAYSQLVPSDYGTASLPSTSSTPSRRLTLDPDGNLRMYSWDYLSLSWIVVAEAVSQFCSRLSASRMPACGLYGVCVDAPKPACAWPPAFRPADINDVSKGCTPINLSLPICQNNQSSDFSATAFLTLPNTDFPSNDILAKNATPFTLCQSLCTSMCICMGFVYDNAQSATCWLKSSMSLGYSPQTESSNRDAYIKLQNSAGFPVANPPQQTVTLAWATSSAFWSQASVVSNTSNFCKFPRSTNNLVSTCPQVSSNSQNFKQKQAVLVKVLAIFLVELFCFLLLWKTNILKHDKNALPAEHAVCRAFTYAELVEATDHFRHALRCGAFGQVFRGTLSNGSQIAVKCLETSSLLLAEAQFRTEIATLGRIHHVNLLRLYGFCAEGDHQRLLVYEFMENGSLKDLLFKEGEERMDQQGPATEGINMLRPRLGWRTRYSICLGTARGLAYLHDDCLNRIMHCDIKPENILLDSALCPKVADFGLARLYGRNETVQVSAVRGTRGYLAPEWVSLRPVSSKADVYSFGMVAIEIVSGRRNFLPTPSAEETGQEEYPTWAFLQVQSGRLEEVMDQSILAELEANGEWYAEVKKVLRIAFLCLHRKAKDRPIMRSIVQMLEGFIPVPDLPSGPGSLPHEVEIADPK